VALRCALSQDRNDAGRLRAAVVTRRSTDVQGLAASWAWTCPTAGATRRSDGEPAGSGTIDAYCHYKYRQHGRGR
jgi:hypothetical protein